MIQYTEKLPAVLYAVRRDRVRRGEGIRVLKDKGEWVFNTDAEKPWAVRVGKTYFTLRDLYPDETEAQRALMQMVAREYKRERDQYLARVAVLQANLPNVKLEKLI